MFHSTLAALRPPSFRRPGRRPAPARCRARPRLEWLECRNVPSAVLDPSFNGSGLQTVPVNFSGVPNPRSVVLQPDGKILVAGSALTGAGTADYAVARLNADGSADASFGSGGTAVLPLPFVAPTSPGGAIALQPDGRIVLAGSTGGSGGTGEFAVVRLTANGSVDPSFGGGEVVVPFTDGSGAALSVTATAVAIDASGKVVVAGPGASSILPLSQASSFAVARLNADGALDASFGAGGKETVSIPAGGMASLGGLAFQPGGQIVLAGSISSMFGLMFNSEFVVARLNATDGSVDPTFGGPGSGGVVLFGFGNGYDTANALAIEPDGRIVVAGGAGFSGSHSTSGLSFSDYAVARLNPDGTFDDTLLSNTGLPGRRTVRLQGSGPPYSDAASGVALAPDGSIVLAGTQAGGLAVIRLNGDGSLAAHGTVPFPNQSLTAGPLTVQPDGKVVAAGTLGAPGTPGQQALLVARLNGVANVAQAAGVFDPASATWYLHSGASAGAPDAGVFRYGGPGWLPLAGDWQGSGQAGIGVYDPSTATWYLRNEAGAGAPDAGVFAYGVAGWLPLTGDWNNSGQAGIGVYDPTTATWYLRNEPDAGAPDAGVFRYGFAGAIPVVGDWTGTGHLGIGVFDPATFTWFLRSSATAGPPDVGVFQYGGVGALPVAGDWSGSGHAGIGVFDPATATWFLRSESNAGAPDVGAFAYGVAGWLPAVGAWRPPAQALAAPGGEGARAAGDDPAPVGGLASAAYGLGVLPGSSAGKEGPLTAVLHEAGHLAGSADSTSGLMAGALAAGTRDTLALDLVFSQGVL
jgi:uncharacterized delta-60 repeat protein